MSEIFSPEKIPQTIDRVAIVIPKYKDPTMTLALLTQSPIAAQVYDEAIRVLDQETVDRIVRVDNKDRDKVQMVSSGLLYNLGLLHHYLSSGDSTSKSQLRPALIFGQDMPSELSALVVAGAITFEDAVYIAYHADELKINRQNFAGSAFKGNLASIQFQDEITTPVIPIAIRKPVTHGSELRGALHVLFQGVSDKTLPEMVEAAAEYELGATGFIVVGQADPYPISEQIRNLSMRYQAVEIRTIHDANRLPLDKVQSQFFPSRRQQNQIGIFPNI